VYITGMGMIWFTSDLHFGHGRIIEYCGRPFSGVDEMNDALITNWNETVKDNDTVYILGDFSWSRHDEFGRLLKGKKYLVPGNHDGCGPAKRLTYLTILPVIYKMSYMGNSFILCHYPMLSWPGSCHDSIHLFGHVHNRSKMDSDVFNYAKTRRMMNVGVDVHGFKPISVEYVMDCFPKEAEQPDNHISELSL
jgi:calcineurin-like phosphoesterase family protein